MVAEMCRVYGSSTALRNPNIALTDNRRRRVNLEVKRNIQLIGRRGIPRQKMTA